MNIQYYLADGQEVKHETDYDDLTYNDIDELALIYTQKNPHKLPSKLFVSVTAFSGLLNNISSYHVVKGERGMVLTVINTSAGPLTVNVVPYAFEDFICMVGTDDDFERYNIDKLFDKIVINPE